jgi:predicted nucleotidyltransferase
MDMLEIGYASLFDTIVSWARDQDAVHALLIAGSVAQGTADAFSDLDLVVVTDEGAIDSLMTEVSKLIDDAEPVIIENRLSPGRASILSVVTDKWHRIDLLFGDAGSGILQQVLMPVLDPDSLYDGAPAEKVPVPVAADRVIAISKEFLRVLGLSVVVLGRRDVHAAHDGANLMRNLLIELFLMEPPSATRSSAKKLLPVLTIEQQGILKSLPPVSDDLKVLAVFNSAITEVFLPRARRLTESIGGSWPTATEHATRAYLQSIKPE